MDAPHETALELLARKLNLHHRLSPEDRQAILDLPHKIRRLEAQSYILREGDRPERCAVLLQGYSFRHKVTGDGSRQILAINVPGEALDFQNLFLEARFAGCDLKLGGTRDFVNGLAESCGDALVRGVHADENAYTENNPGRGQQPTQQMLTRIRPADEEQ